ncbi:MAG: hypothetical protein KAI64_00800, partial [Thermoplasmata archaeon]|nr:hypothetical protein [Thermoplasmata archaeon]
MAGNLRHIKLWKQLEQKAKEATKTRGLAEQTLEAAEKLIEEAKSADADVTESLKTLTEASSALTDKDYKLAYEKARECKIKILKEYRDRIRKILDSSKFLLSLVNKEEGDTSGEENALKLAEDAFSKGDFAKSVEMAKDSWKRSEKVLHEHISKMFSSAQSLILAAQNTGKDIKMSEELLVRAREALDASDYELAINTTKECLEDVGAALKDEVYEHIDDAKTMIEHARDVGYDTKRLESSLQRVHTEMDKYAFDAALNYAKKNKIDAEKALKRAISDKLDSYRAKVREAEKLEADVSDVEDIVAEAKDALKEANYKNAISLIKEADETIDNAKFEIVLETVSESREKFIIAKNIGADIKKALRLLNKARDSLKNRKYDEALRLARRSDEEISSVTREFESVQSDIEYIERSIGLGDETGVDTIELKSDLEKAKLAFEDKNFNVFMENVKKTKEGVRKSFSKKTEKNIGKLQSYITMGGEMGIELADLKSIMEDAKEHENKKEYDQALSLSGNAISESEEKFRTHLRNSITALEDTIKLNISKLKDATPFNELLEKAGECLDAGDFVEAYKFTKKGTESLGSELFNEVKGMLLKAENVIEFAKELNIDVEGLDEKMTLGKKALSEKKYDEGLAICIDIANSLAGHVDKVFIDLKEKLVELKNIKVDIASFLVPLKEAAARKKEGDTLGTFEKLLETHKKAYSILEGRKKASDTISSSAVTIAEAKKKNIDIKQVIPKLLESKKHYEANEYEKSIQLAEEASAETKRLVDLQVTSQKILDVKDKIPVARELKIEFKNVTDNLAKATEALKNKDFDTALKHSTDAEIEITEALKNELNASLSALQSLISEAKEVGINVGIAEEHFHKSSDSLAKDDFKESGKFAVSAREEIKRQQELSKKAASTIRTAQNMANEAESMNILVPKQKDLLKKAM